MATVNLVRSQLQENASKIEMLLQYVRPNLAKLKDAAVAQRCQAEAKSLKAENAALRLEVAALVAKLNKLEESKGVKQVSVVTGVSAAPVQKLAKESPPTVTSEKVSVKENVKKEKQVKTSKEPKVKESDSAEETVDVSRLLMKVGKIVDVKKHPDADSLYIETVDLAEEKPRTIVSGLVKHVPIEQMQDRLAVFLCNLKPAKLKGVMSEGMIMCASKPEKVQVIDVPPGAVPGDVISFDQYPGKADDLLNPKKKIWETVQPDLSINDEGVATYKGSPFTVIGKGVCRAPGCPNFPIK